MKGLIALFLAVSLVGIAWGYADKASRNGVTKTLRKNLLPIVFGVLAVAAAIVFSANSTVRFM